VVGLGHPTTGFALRDTDILVMNVQRTTQSLSTWMNLNEWTHVAMTRDTNNMIRVWVGTTLRASFTVSGTLNPYRTDFNGTHNSGLWIGRSGQHGGYGWNGQIAECTLSKNFVNIATETITDVFTVADRSNLIVANSHTASSTFAAVNPLTTAASNPFQLTGTAVWISSTILMGQAWQRLYVQLSQPVTIRRVRIQNIATSEAMTVPGNAVRGGRWMQVLVRNADPGWDRSFTNDIVYENTDLPDNSTTTGGIRRAGGFHRHRKSSTSPQWRVERSSYSTFKGPSMAPQMCAWEFESWDSVGPCSCYRRAQRVRFVFVPVRA
jgi:hypothetical protein